MKHKILIFLLFILFLCSTFFSITGFLYKRFRDSVNEGFYLKGQNQITLEYGQKYNEEGFIAKINNKSYTDQVKVESNVNINKIGVYKITYTLEIMNYTKILNRLVEVVDTASPELTVKCDNEQYIALKGNVDKCEVSASDNYDKELTDKIVIDSNLDNKKVGDYKITYSVTDSSNNTTTKDIKIYVRKKFDITYVNVSINKQRLDYYQNKKLVLTTPITSGKYNATKIGSFKVLNKATDTTLRGENYVSFVKYWMGYGGGYGLHDASWRSVFGTKDYYYNGSHGCINMPTPAAKKLYNMIEIGTPIYIKK